jgi:hypothetical protein
LISWRALLAWPPLCTRDPGATGNCIPETYREVLSIRPGRPIFFAVLGCFVAEVGPKTLLNGSGSIFCCRNQGSFAQGTIFKAILVVGDRPGGPPGAIRKTVLAAVVHPGPRCAWELYTLGFLIHDFWSCRRSSIFGVWAAPGAPHTTPKGGGLRPPPSEMAFAAAGAAQTLKISDFRTAQKSCIKNPSVSSSQSHLGPGCTVCGATRPQKSAISGRPKNHVLKTQV